MDNKQKFQATSKGLSADDLIKNILEKVDTDAKISKRYNTQNRNVAKANTSQFEAPANPTNILLLPKCLQRSELLPRIYWDMWENFKDGNNLEFCDTGKLYSQLLHSNLPNNVLAQLWSFVNRTIPGQITRVELFIMLTLIALLQANVVDPFKELYLIDRPPTPKFANVQAASKPEHPPQQANDDEEFSDFKSVEPIPAEQTSTVDSLQLIDCTPQVQLGGDFGPINTTNDNIGIDKFADEELKFTPVVEEMEDEFGDFYSYSKVTESNQSVVEEGEDIRFEPTSETMSKQRRVLNAIDQVMHRTFNILTVNHDQDSVSQLFHAKEGIDFAQDLMEVFQVCNRIKGNLSLVNKFSQPEIDACLAIVMEIEHKHNFIQNIFRKCAITFAEPTTEASPGQLGAMCSICYVQCGGGGGGGVHPADQLNFAGLSYHASCANFWLNHVAALLPNSISPYD